MYFIPQITEFHRTASTYNPNPRQNMKNEKNERENISSFKKILWNRCTNEPQFCLYFFSSRMFWSNVLVSIMCIFGGFKCANRFAGDVILIGVSFSLFLTNLRKLLGTTQLCNCVTVLNCQYKLYCIAREISRSNKSLKWKWGWDWG